MMGKTSHDTWDLLRLDDALGRTQLRIELDGQRRTVSFYALDVTGQIQTVHFNGGSQKVCYAYKVVCHKRFAMHIR